MHRRLRRHLDECLGEEPDSSPHLRRLILKIDKEFRRADEDRASLQRALALLADLQRRQPEAEPRHTTSPKARSVSRLFDQAPFAALLCDGDRKVTAWNAAAEQLFGIPGSDAVGRELSMLVFPDTGADRAQERTELRQMLENGGTQQLMRATPTRAGLTRTCEWTIVPLHDRKGREVGNAFLVQERDPVPDRYALAWEGAGDGIWKTPTSGCRTRGGRSSARSPAARLRGNGSTASIRRTGRRCKPPSTPTSGGPRPASGASTASATTTDPGAGCWSAARPRATTRARRCASPAR
jgi:PAS domain S-box-containing protein